MSQAGTLSQGSGGGSGIITINGDIGSITGSTVQIYANHADTNCGSSVLFDNSGTVSTLNVTDSNGNTIIGNDSGNLVNPGKQNTILGANAGTSLTGNDDTADATTNVLIGYNAGNALTTGFTNVVIGAGSLAIGTSAIANTIVGYAAAESLLTGEVNIIIGENAGENYTSSESSNIIIGSTVGIVGDSNLIRIGHQGSGTGEQDECFIAGIVGVTNSNAQTVTIDSTSGQLGVLPQEYFSTYLSAPTGNVTGNNTTYNITFDQALTNSSGSYDTSTGIYTAPSTGQYSFSSTVALVGGDALTLGYLLLWDGSVYSTRAFQIIPTASASTQTTILSAHISIPMTAGDQMKISVNVNGTNENIEVFGSSPVQGTGVLAVCSTFSGFRFA